MKKCLFVIMLTIIIGLIMVMVNYQPVKTEVQYIPLSSEYIPYDDDTDNNFTFECFPENYLLYILAAQ